MSALLSTKLLLLLSILAAATLVNFSWIHQFQDADTLLFALISLDRYLPFYWGDNRFGMLLPALALPIRDYFWNLLFQTQMCILAVAACVVIFQCWFARKEKGLTITNLSASALTLVIGGLCFYPTVRTIRVLFLGHPYCPSLALALGGLALLRNCRLGWGALALLCSFWITRTNAPLVLGCLLLLPGSEKSWAERLHGRWRGFAVTLAAAAVVSLLALGYPVAMEAGIAPLTSFLNSGLNLWRNLVGSILRLWVVVVLALIWFLAQFRKGRDHESLATGAVFLLLGSGMAGAITASEWVIMNVYEPRYWMVPVLLALLVFTSATSELILDAAKKWVGSSLAAAAASVVLLGASLLTFGSPSVSRVRGDLDSITGAHYARINELECTHMLGSYWVAWHSVFYNRLHDLSPRLWAVSLRSEATDQLWTTVPKEQRRYCGVCGDSENNRQQIVFQLIPLRQTGSNGDLCLFQP